MTDEDMADRKRQLLKKMETRTRRDPGRASAIDRQADGLERAAASLTRNPQQPGRAGGGMGAAAAARGGLQGKGIARVVKVLTGPEAGPKIAGTRIGQDGLLQFVNALEQRSGSDPSGLPNRILNFLKQPGGEQVCGVSVEQLKKLEQLVGRMQSKGGLAGALGGGRGGAAAEGMRQPASRAGAAKGAPEPARAGGKNADEEPWIQSLADEIG